MLSSNSLSGTPKSQGFSIIALVFTFFLHRKATVLLSSSVGIWPNSLFFLIRLIASSSGHFRNFVNLFATIFWFGSYWIGAVLSSFLFREEVVAGPQKNLDKQNELLSTFVSEQFFNSLQLFSILFWLWASTPKKVWPFKIGFAGLETLSHDEALSKSHQSSSSSPR